MHVAAAQEKLKRKDDSGVPLGVVAAGFPDCKAALNGSSFVPGHNHGREDDNTISSSGGPGDITRYDGQDDDIHGSRTTLILDAGKESPKRPDSNVASKDDDPQASLQLIRAEVQMLASSLVTFGRQLQQLQQKQLRHETSSREDTSNLFTLLSKVEGLQSLCRDTATMGMKHAEAMLGIGFRIEVLEKQVAPLLDDKNDEPTTPVAAPADAFASGPSDTLSKVDRPGNSADPQMSSSVAALTQQFSETALKVYGQVSSIECRMEKLEERVSSEVRRAVNNLGLLSPGKDELQIALGNSFEIASTCSSHGEAFNTVQADLVKQVEGLLNHVTQVEGLLQPAQLPPGPPRHTSSAGSSYVAYPQVTVRTGSHDSRAPSPKLGAANRQGSLPPTTHQQRWQAGWQTVPSTPTTPTPAYRALGGSITIPIERPKSVERTQIAPPHYTTQVRGRLMEPSHLVANHLSVVSSPVRQAPVKQNRSETPTAVPVNPMPGFGAPLDSRNEQHMAVPLSPMPGCRALLESTNGSLHTSPIRILTSQGQMKTGAGTTREGRVERLIQQWTKPGPSRNSTPLKMTSRNSTPLKTSQGQYETTSI